MNSRNSSNEGGNGGSGSANRTSLISHLRQMFNREESSSSMTGGSANRTTSNREEEPVLTRDVLQAVWNRMQNLPSSQRTMLFNSLNLGAAANIPPNQRESESDREDRDEESEAEEEDGSTNRYRRRYRFYDEEAESQDEVLNPQEEEDYIDFRTYPLQIDWGEIENEKSHAYQIWDKFGYFGVSVFSSLSNLSSLILSPKTFLSKIVDYYWQLFDKYTQSGINNNKKSGEVISQIEEFISNLPKLELIREVIYQRLITRKELTCLKIVLDIYQNYYNNFDHPLYNNLTYEFIPTALLFYSTLPDEDTIYIYEKLTQASMKETYKLLKNKLGAVIEKKRSSYLKHLKSLKGGVTQLCGGLDKSKFVV